MKVTVKNLNYGKVHNAPSTYIHEGDEVPVPKWVDYPAIALTTGERSFPVRIISRDTILSINDAKVESKFSADPVKRTVQVSGSKGSVYVVTIDGKYKSCNCPGFQFRRNCRHVVEVA